MSALNHTTKHAPAPAVPMDIPSAAKSEQALRRARRLFHRTLAGWASDVLELKRAGADRPSWRGAPLNGGRRQAA